MPSIWTVVRAQAVKGLMSGGIQADLKRAQSLGIRDSLAILEDTHKRKVIGRKGGPPVKRVWTTRSGQLSRSFRSDYRMGDTSGTYGSAYWLSEVQEKGKTIRARNAPYLRFKTHDGKWHMVKKVVLPPRPTLKIALRKSRQDRNKIVDKHIDTALREGF